MRPHNIQGNADVIKRIPGFYKKLERSVFTGGSDFLCKTCAGCHFVSQNFKRQVYISPSPLDLNLKENGITPVHFPMMCFKYSRIFALEN